MPEPEDLENLVPVAAPEPAAPAQQQDILDAALEVSGIGLQLAPDQQPMELALETLQEEEEPTPVRIILTDT